MHGCVHTYGMYWENCIPKELCSGQYRILGAIIAKSYHWGRGGSLSPILSCPPYCASGGKRRRPAVGTPAPGRESPDVRNPTSDLHTRVAPSATKAAHLLTQANCEDEQGFLFL